MSLGLVSRSARAFSDHLNAYFRVLKGVDPDSVWLRLPGGGGSFEVRHSATAAPILRVTDAGIAAQIGTAAIADGAITSVKIADGTIVGADIANNTITSNKIVTGAPITPGSITATELADGAVTSLKIADGTIATADLLANAVTRVHLNTALAGTQVNQTSPQNLLTQSITSSGGYFIALIGGYASNAAANTITFWGMAWDATPFQQFCGFQSGPTANYMYNFGGVFPIGVLSAGAHNVALQWQVNVATATTIGAGYYLLIELKK